MGRHCGTWHTRLQAVSSSVMWVCLWEVSACLQDLYMCHNSDCICSLISVSRSKVKHWKKKRKLDGIFLSVDSLLLFAFASLSARPSQTPASRSPGGTPPSSASRAGTPRSCHTCGGKDMYDISVLARPLNSPFLLTPVKNNSQSSPRTTVFSPLMVAKERKETC